MTQANRLLVIVGAIAAISAAIYSIAFVYQVWKQEQRADEATRGVISAKIDTDEVTDDAITFTVAIHSEGPRKLFTLKYCVFSDPLPNPSHSLHDCPSIVTKGPFAVLPHDNWPIKIRVSDAYIAKVRARKLYFFFCGAIYYKDFDKEREIPLCAVYSEDFKRMGDCSDLQKQ